MAWRDVTHLFWPESSFPFILSRDGAALSMLASRLQNAVLFTGAARAEGEGRNTQYFNAIQVIFGGEVKESYDKRHLVPFGEYMPFARLLGRLGDHPIRRDSRRLQFGSVVAFPDRARPAAGLADGLLRIDFPE